MVGGERLCLKRKGIECKTMLKTDSVVERVEKNQKLGRSLVTYNGELNLSRGCNASSTSNHIAAKVIG